MKENKNTKPVSVVNQDDYDVIESILEKKNKPLSFCENPVASLAIMIICFIADMSLFTNLLSPLLNDSKEMIALGVCGLIIAVDLCAVWLGYMYKKHAQGYRVDKLVMITAIIMIVGGFIVYGCLRYQGRNIFFSSSSRATNLMTEKADSQKAHPMASMLSIFMAVLPVLTSGVSFVVSFLASNPAQKELTQIEKSIHKLVKELNKDEAMLTELLCDPCTKEKAERQEEVLFLNKIEDVCEKTKYEVDYSIMRIKEYIGTPEGISALSQPVYEDLSKYLNERSSEEIVNRLREEMIDEPKRIHPEDYGEAQNCDHPGEERLRYIRPSLALSDADDRKVS